MQGGLYVSPHPWEKDVRACAEQLALTGEITTASTDDLDIGGEHDPRELARRLWPIDDLAARYTALCEEYSPVIDLLEDMKSRHEKMPDTTFLPGALGMAVTFMDCFGDDPCCRRTCCPGRGRDARRASSSSTAGASPSACARRPVGPPCSGCGTTPCKP